MKKNKIISVFIALMLIFTTSACSNNNTGEKYYDFSDENFVTGTLHKVDVKENLERQFVVNKQTDYVIVLSDESSYAERAAGLIIQNVKRATGAHLSTRVYYDGMENSWNDDSKFIVLNSKPLFNKANLTMPEEELGESGYFIKTVGNSVFIMNPKKYGYQMGAIKFLEQTLGYDMLGDNAWFYGKEGKTIPDMNIVEKPDFDYRGPSNLMDSSTAYGMGFNLTNKADVNMFIKDDSGTREDRRSHTSFNILPPELYAEEHPDWYWGLGNDQTEQLCYIARGSYKTAEEDRENGVENEFNVMVQTAYEKIMRTIDENPEKPYLAVSIMDNKNHCECDACLETKNYYGGAISATNIIFLNAVDKLIQNELQRRADENGTEKRVFNLIHSAYETMLKPPVYLDVDGVYKPIDEKVVMSETIAVDIAPINSYFNSTFYEDVNMLYGEAKDIMGWAAVCKSLQVWLYEDNFLDYFSPFNTYDSQIENYRFCYNAGANYMISQGQTVIKHPTTFSKFKDYINSKAYFNLNLTYKEIEKNYFDRYFLDAKEPMYSFFKEMQGHLEYLESTDVSVTGKIYNPLLDSTQYFSERQLGGYLDYVDQAYELIEKYKDNDQETYDKLYKHILIESLFPRYALLQLYPSSFIGNEQLAEKLKFKEDCEYLSFSHWSESKQSISNLWQLWGIK